MLEFSNLGAGVLHNKSVKVAKDNDIKLIVRSSMSKANGTTVANIYSKCCTLPKITGVTSNDNVVSIVGLDLDLEVKGKIIKALDNKDIPYSNIDKSDMRISIVTEKERVNDCINCIHDLFFKVN